MATQPKRLAKKIRIIAGNSLQLGQEHRQSQHPERKCFDKGAGSERPPTAVQIGLFGSWPFLLKA
jgi:hypothetical protein